MPTGRPPARLADCRRKSSPRVRILKESQLQALLFDVDGTLADTEGEGHRPAYNLAFRALGLEWDWHPRLYRELLAVSGGRERIAHYLDAYTPPLGDQADEIRRNRTAWIDSAHRLKTRFFRERLAAGQLGLRPGVARLLRAAAERGVSCGLVTNATRPSLALMVDHLLGDELEKAVTATACGDEVAAKKPAPDLYRLALERLEAEPASCIAVEDAASGLQSAASAGVPTVVAVNDDTRSQDFTGARLVVSDLGEPGAPPEVLAGPPPPEGYVTLNTLAALIERSG